MKSNQQLLNKIETLANLQAEYFNPGRQELLDKLVKEYSNKVKKDDNFILNSKKEQKQ